MSLHQSRQMIKNFFLALFIFCAINQSSAQKKDFTITEAVMGLRSNLALESISQLQWHSKEDAYSQFLSANGTQYFLLTKVANNQVDTIISLNTFNDLVKGINLEAAKRLPALIWLQNGNAAFKYSDKFLEYNLLTKSISIKYDLPKDMEEEVYTEDYAKIAFLRENNVFVFDGKTEKQVTNDAADGIVNGTTVHRSEFGITNGLFWSKDGSKLAYYRMDETMVEKYPIFELEAIPTTVRNVRYPMAGRTSHHVKVFVYDVASANKTEIKTEGPAEQYLTNLAFTPDAKTLFIAVLNRGQNHMKLNTYDSNSGNFIKTLFEEKHEKYVEPEYPAMFLGKGNQFVWQSDRDGFSQLFLYDLNGKLLKKLTTNKCDVKVLGTDVKQSKLFLSGSFKGDYRRTDIAELTVSSAKLKVLNKSDGSNMSLFSNSGNYFINYFSSADVPRIISLNSTDGKVNKTLLTSKNTLENYNTATVKNVQMKTSTGIPLYGKIMLPHDFDSTKKYPVVVYLYGGPHLQLISDRWPASGNLWYDYMTQNGFIVFSMDNRGSSGRGQDFENAIHKEVGSKEMEDQLTGVAYLKTLPYVDADRLGVHGWSFGGFMTTSLLTRYPGVFKVGVAGGPVIDWKMYEVMYTERYMGHPEANAKGYEDNNLLNYAKDLEGRLLMIHGTDDDVVVWQHSLAFVQKCVEEGVLIDYMVYPGHPHNVGGKDRIHLMKTISQYIFDHLK